MTRTGASRFTRSARSRSSSSSGKGRGLVVRGSQPVECVGEEDLRPLAPPPPAPPPPPPPPPRVRQLRVELLHGEPDLQMGDHEGRRHDLEAEHPLRRRPLHRAPASAPMPRPLQVGGDAAQDFRQIGPGAAARVQHIDVVRRETAGDAEVVLECPGPRGRPCSAPLPPACTRRRAACAGRGRRPRGTARRNRAPAAPPGKRAKKGWAVHAGRVRPPSSPASPPARAAAGGRGRRAAGRAPAAPARAGARPPCAMSNAPVAGVCRAHSTQAEKTP